MMHHKFYSVLLLLGLGLIGCDTPSSTPMTKPQFVEGPTAKPISQKANQEGEFLAANTASQEQRKDEEKEAAPEKTPPIPKGAVRLIKDQDILFFEKEANGKRKVHLLAEVCLREGPLEFLLSKKTKEHESILLTDIDARLIHTALVAAGAEPGTPVQFWNPKTEMEEYKAATGAKIQVTLTFHRNGKLLSEPAQNWIKDMKTKKEMAYDWVFAGSRFYKDPDDPNAKEYYCANNGEVISISNFPDSMLELPIKSSNENAERFFVANTEKIPPRKTKVLITMEPVVEEKKKK